MFDDQAGKWRRSRQELREKAFISNEPRALLSLSPSVLKLATPEDDSLLDSWLGVLNCEEAKVADSYSFLSGLLEF